MAVVYLMKEWCWLLCHDGSPITEAGINEANMGTQYGRNSYWSPDGGRCATADRDPIVHTLQYHGSPAADIGQENARETLPPAPGISEDVDRWIEYIEICGM